jgi:hypothetical protein
MWIPERGRREINFSRTENHSWNLSFSHLILLFSGTCHHAIRQNFINKSEKRTAWYLESTINFCRWAGWLTQHLFSQLHFGPWRWRQYSSEWKWSYISENSTVLSYSFFISQLNLLSSFKLRTQRYETSLKSLLAWGHYVLLKFFWKNEIKGCFFFSVFKEIHFEDPSESFIPFRITTQVYIWVLCIWKQRLL